VSDHGKEALGWLRGYLVENGSYAACSRLDTLTDALDSALSDREALIKVVRCVMRDDYGMAVETQMALAALPEHLKQEIGA
jgi:hypothetical protein